MLYINKWTFYVLYIVHVFIYYQYICRLKYTVHIVQYRFSTCNSFDWLYVYRYDCILVHYFTTHYCIINNPTPDHLTLITVHTIITTWFLYYLPCFVLFEHFKKHSFFWHRFASWQNYSYMMSKQPMYKIFSDVPTQLKPNIITWYL